MTQENKRPAFVISTERVYLSFKDEIDILRNTAPSAKTNIPIRDITVSAYVKCYDFVVHLCSIPDVKSSFFYLPALRSICEDLISITYILNKDEESRNYLVAMKRHRELRRTTTAQEIFFTKFNPHQIIPPVCSFENENALEKAYTDAGHKMKECEFPNVKQMANEVGLGELYDYIYHATSKSVHFDINTLLSMGWGPIDEKDETIIANYSHQHDHRYYYTFTLFYASFLFLRQTERFKNFLCLPSTVSDNLKEVENGYRNIDWPEAVTFNHLNIPQPNIAERALYRILKSEELKG